MSLGSRHLVRRLVALAWLVAASLAVTAAFAVGRVQWKSTTVKETSNKAWNIEVAIYLNGAPDVPTIPMKFEFEPITYFERAMLDGDKLVERKVPLEGRQALIENVDVGFLDAGSGKIEKRTKFTFKVTRAHGYDAGEYMVKIRDSRNGQQVGNVTKLTFDGENEVIDRRSIVFTGEKKKKKQAKEGEGSGESKDEKKDEKSAGGESGSSESKAEQPPDEKSEASGGESAAGEGQASDEPAPIKEKPGGCGCRTPGARAPAGSLGLLAAAALALGLARSRTPRRVRERRAIRDAL